MEGGLPFRGAAPTAHALNGPEAAHRCPEPQLPSTQEDQICRAAPPHQVAERGGAGIIWLLRLRRADLPGRIPPCPQPLAARRTRER